VQADPHGVPMLQMLAAAVRENDTAFGKAFADLLAGDLNAAGLSPKVRELVCFALNIAVSHLNEGWAKHHLLAAKAQGATREELKQVCRLAMLIGIHSVTLAAPFLAEAFADDSGAATPLRETQQRVRDDFVADRGMIPAPLDALLRMDPEFVDSYRRLSALPFQGPLSKKDAELIVVALDASVNHMFSPGCRYHMLAAHSAGASFAEVLEVLKLATGMAGQGTALGLKLIHDAF